MKYLQERDPRFQHLGLKVGSFIAFFVLLLLIMAAMLGWRQDLFQPAVWYRISPGSADAIFPGMNVTLHGIRVGRVQKVAFGSDAKPLVTLRVFRHAAEWLRADAEAVLSGTGPLETPYIDLVPGSAEKSPLASDARLPFRREPNLAETLSGLEEQMRPVIASASSFLDELNRKDGDLRLSIAGLRTFADTLNADVPPVLDDAEKAISSLRRSSADIESAVDQVSPQLQELLRRSNEAALRAENLLGDLRKVWVFKALLPKEQAQGRPAPVPKKAAP